MPQKKTLSNELAMHNGKILILAREFKKPQLRVLEYQIYNFQAINYLH